MNQQKCQRREFLKFLGAATATFITPKWLTAAVTSKKRPNVVIIFTDDQGTIDANCFGAHDLHTPNLDSLARKGIRFTQFYVGAPVCSPSRAALMTGRYPQRAQLDTNAPCQKGHAGMPTQQLTIAELLKSAGYTTGHVGKWHMGYTPETMPNGQGFDFTFGHMGGCIDNYSHFFYWEPPNLHDLWQNGKEVWRDGEFFGDLMVEKCQEFIEKNKNNPFFLYWAINMPHYPQQGQEKYRQMYKDYQEPRKSYAAFVSTLDEKIGKVVNTLDKLGLRENTLIIFLSDHGHSEEIRNNYEGSGGNAGPHRGHKFTLWEGGIRVPCIVSWPGRLPEGEVRGEKAISIDWLPTIAHYCEVEMPDRKIDGLNISALIESDKSLSPHDIMYWQLRKQWCVRQGDWKLVVNGPGSEFKGKKIPPEKIFLTNLAEDQSETHNQAKKHPEIVEKLTKYHDAWFEEVFKQ